MSLTKTASCDLVLTGLSTFANIMEAKLLSLIIPKLVSTKQVDDLVSFIHVFFCRLSGLRRYKTKIEKDPNLKGGEDK